LDSYYLLYAVLGDFELRRGNFRVAAEHLRKALSLAELQSEKAFLAKQISACEDRIDSSVASRRKTREPAAV
jgi:RNA polymerase sigma-70 factor (ECF subfamily)